MNVFFYDAHLFDVVHAARAEPTHDAIDEPLGRRRARCDANGARALEPGVLDLGLVVDEVGARAARGGYLGQPVRVR